MSFHRRNANSSSWASGHNFHESHPSHHREAEMHPESYQCQKQAFMQFQRSADASAQMVYEVYGNLIGILEEFEERELKEKKVKTNLPRSEIVIPSQSKKEDKDVKGVLETQLLIFETQLKSCRKDIREVVKANLYGLTMQWNAERSTLPNDHETDRYAGQLLEILTLGSSAHPRDFYQAPGDVQGVTLEHMQTVIGAQHKIGELDRKFQDPHMRPSTPKIRSGDRKAGADRFRSTREDLREHIQGCENMDIK